ncbi:MAG: hypothetical protein ABID61_06515 [Candidatus Micrarchaeota archaeon]
MTKKNNSSSKSKITKQTSKKKAQKSKVKIKEAPKKKSFVISINKKVKFSKSAKSHNLNNRDEAYTPKITEAEKEDMKKVNRVLTDSFVRQILIDVGGENALAIIRNFYGNLSDDELAKRLKLKISDVRATLNKLHNQGLVTYIRDKDNQTGWYSYSWALNKEKMHDWAITQSKKKDCLNGTNGEHYFCPTCGIPSVQEFSDACEKSFRCERCNKMLEFLDAEKIEELNSNAYLKR